MEFEELFVHMFETDLKDVDCTLSHDWQALGKVIIIIIESSSFNLFWSYWIDRFESNDVADCYSIKSFD